jgi:GAF domain-containing protein
LSDSTLGPSTAAWLYSVAQALTGALTAVDVARVVFDRVAEAGASSTGLWLVEAGTIRFVGGAGMSEGLPSRVTAMPLDSSLPAAEAVRTGLIVTYGSRAERNRRWPTLQDVDSLSEATAVLPLTAPTRPLGCLHISYPVEMDEADFDRPLLGQLAELCAAALDRAQMHDAERDRQAFLLEAAAAVSNASTFAESLHRLASVAVPRMADLCLIDVWDGRGGISRMAAVHADPGAAALVEELKTKYAPVTDGVHPSYQTMTGGRSLWMADMSEAFLRETARDARHFEIAQALKFTSFMSVPLRVAGEMLGAMTLLSAGSGRRFGRADLTLAEQLAVQVGDVVWAARRHEREHEVAHVLQRLLLPAALPEIEGVVAAARYLTARRDVEAGGDFYDMAELPSGRIGFVIGDVEGHDPVAAATMGQLRSAIRALAGQHREPHLLIDALRWSWDLLGFTRMATCLVGRLDPADGSVVMCSAGHLPPVEIAVDGTARFLSVDRSPPLGAPAGAAVDSIHRLEPGSTLFLYTDGLVEKPHSPIDEDLTELLRILAGTAAMPVDELCERVLSDRPAATELNDDIAILAIRTSGRPAGD